jgi:23S rRNA U2552 (ribose-2'-O)-methylase RlmE/FtsJ
MNLPLEKKILIINLKDPSFKYNSSNIENITLDFNQSLLNIKISENEIMNKILSRYKDLITEINNNKLWEIFKKYINEFELVYLSNYKILSISKYIPISRSFFKMWEMLNEYNLLDKYKNINIKTTHIAEGPGGFIDALIQWRCKYSNTIYKKDNINAITLKSTKKDIPGWKKSKNFLKENPNINISYGEDNTGNIYNIRNIDHYVNEIGKDTCDFCTADGGFDYSIDFNHQEQLSYRIILCEILIAISVQKKDGIFICKIFDIYTLFTIKILYILGIFYENVIITKPFLSRPANSEKYIIASGFRGYNDERLVLYNKIYYLIKDWYYNKNENETDENTLNRIINISIPRDFINIIINYNIYNTKKQIISLLKAFELINTYNDDKEILDKQILYQIDVAHSWCKKYNIDIRNMN